MWWRNIDKNQYTYCSLMLHLLKRSVVSVEKRTRVMNVAGSSPKYWISMMEIDKQAQPMSDIEMGSFYASSSILPWWTDQMKILDMRKLWFTIDNIRFEAACLTQLTSLLQEAWKELGSLIIGFYKWKYQENITH